MEWKKKIWKISVFVYLTYHYYFLTFASNNLRNYSKYILSFSDGGSWSDGSDWGSVSSNSQGVVFDTTGSEIADRSWSTSELVQGSHQESLEDVGLLVSDPSFLVLVEVVPGVLEVGVHVGWHLGWLELVSGLKDGSRSDFGVILHKEFLSSLVAGWGSSLLGESRENVIHNFIFISSVVSRKFLIFPSFGAWDVLTIWVRVISDFNSSSGWDNGNKGKIFHLIF